MVARFVFGKGHPAISFLLLLAIADDAIGLAIIAIFYPDPGHPVFPPALTLVLLGISIAWGLRQMRVTNYWPYLLLGGTASWLGLFWAHLHPALALVFIVPFMPHFRHGSQLSVYEVPEDEHSTLSDFEHEWKVVVDFGLLLFGLTNSGVQFTSVGTVTWLVFFSLLVGKTMGIYGFGLAAMAFGFQLPAGMNRRDLFLASMIGGMGLTVALFVAGAAFADPQIKGAAKMGSSALSMKPPD